MDVGVFYRTQPMGYRQWEENEREDEEEWQLHCHPRNRRECYDLQGGIRKCRAKKSLGIVFNRVFAELIFISTLYITHQLHCPIRDYCFPPAAVRWNSNWCSIRPSFSPLVAAADETFYTSLCLSIMIVSMVSIEGL